MMRYALTEMLLRTSSESNLRPISRFTAKTVASGLVMACRLAICPTSRSPASVNPTIEGVVRLPSELGITTGSPPSMTATHELVVPRSMPMTLAMLGGIPAGILPQQMSPRRSNRRASSAVSAFRRRGASFGHNHRRGPDQAVVQLVTPGHLGDDGVGRLVAFLLHQRLVHGGVEGLAQRREAHHAVLRKRGFEQFLHQLDALDHLLEVVLLGVVERALEVVHHRQEILQESLGAELLRVLLLLQRALLEIFEFGGSAQEALVGLLQALAGLAGALERLFQLSLEDLQLALELVEVLGWLRLAGLLLLGNAALFGDRRFRRDLGIVWNHGGA